MDPYHRTASEIHVVFAANLRKLSAKAPSVSQLCRDLEINRTQYNRYLNGEAHPRPEILARICAHFGRDARILLEPLDEIGQAAPSRPVEIDDGPFLRKQLNFDHVRLPDGLYRLILPSFMNREMTHIMLIRLFTLGNGGKGVHWSVPAFFAGMTGQSQLWRDRKQAGYCYQLTDGVSMTHASDYSGFIRTSYFTYGYMGMENVHVGYSAVTQARREGHTQVQPTILERLRPTTAAMIAGRRSVTDFGRDSLSPAYKRYLDTWSAP